MAYEYNRIPPEALSHDEYEENVQGLTDFKCPLCLKPFIKGTRCFHFAFSDPRRPVGADKQHIADGYICHRCMKEPFNRPLAEIVARGEEVPDAQREG